MSKIRNSKERIKEQTRKNTQAFKVKKWQFKLDTKNALLIERRLGEKTNQTNPKQTNQPHPQNWYAVRKGLEWELAEIRTKTRVIFLFNFQCEQYQP